MAAPGRLRSLVILKIVLNVRPLTVREPTFRNQNCGGRSLRFVDCTLPHFGVDHYQGDYVFNAVSPLAGGLWGGRFYRFRWQPSNGIWGNLLRNTQLGRSGAYKMLRKAADEAGLRDIGTHTLRKTFGYHMYRKTKDVALLQELFNHSSPATTLRYIGVTQDSMDQAMKEFSL